MRKELKMLHNTFGGPYELEIPYNPVGSKSKTYTRKETPAKTRVKWNSKRQKWCIINKLGIVSEHNTEQEALEVLRRIK